MLDCRTIRVLTRILEADLLFQLKGPVMGETTLIDLAATIKARRSSTGDASYTKQLLDGGVERCAKKFGEEAFEVVIAGLSQPEAALRSEAADVLFHLLVLLESRGVAIGDVLSVLEGRMGQSGHEEKASRGAPAVKS